MEISAVLQTRSKPKYPGLGNEIPQKFSKSYIVII